MLVPQHPTPMLLQKNVDDNSSGRPKTSLLTVDSNIDMKVTYRIQNLKVPIDADEPATKQYADIRFFYRDGSHPMTGNVNMNNNQINNLPLPTGNSQPTTKGFTDLAYLARNGTTPMLNNLNMDNKSIINLRPPKNDPDAATKKYVDDSIPVTSSFIKKMEV